MEVLLRRPKREVARHPASLAGVIGVSVLTLKNPHFKVIGDHIRSEGAKYGYETIVVSADEDVAKQSNQVKDFIVRGVAAIVLSPCESKSIVPVIQEANRAGIPVFTVDIPCLEEGVEIACQIATDNVQGGREAARAMIEALGEAGGKVAILHFKQAESCRLRVQGFREVIQEHQAEGGGGIEIVTELEAGGSKDHGYRATEDVLQAHPDLSGIFAINDPSALGARAALEKAGRPTKLSSSDSTANRRGSRRSGTAKSTRTRFNSPTRWESKSSTALSSIIRERSFHRRSSFQLASFGRVTFPSGLVLGRMGAFPKPAVNFSQKLQAHPDSTSPRLPTFLVATSPLTNANSYCILSATLVGLRHGFRAAWFRCAVQYPHAEPAVSFRRRGRSPGGSRSLCSVRPTRHGSGCRRGIRGGRTVCSPAPRGVIRVGKPDCGHGAWSTSGRSPRIGPFAEEGELLDVIACTRPASSWLVFANLAELSPRFASTQILSPQPYWWPDFLKRDNLLNIANQISVIAIVAIGMTLVIITAGIDLSVGSLIALSAVTSTLLIRDVAGGLDATPGGMVLCCLAGIALTGSVGAFSGLMVTRLEIPPFIVTLGMMLVAGGTAYSLSRGESISQVPASFVWLGRGSTLFQLPNAAILMLLLYVAAHILTTRTPLGRYFYAVGGNIEAARLSGVPVQRVLLLAYVSSGVLAGLGGVVMASQLKSGSPNYGQMYELYVIAAVVVGGTSLAGGRGKVFGTLIGAFIIAVIQNGMNLTGIESYTQRIVLGSVILLAVCADRWKRSWLAGRLERRRTGT
jgi:ribose transport system permease protein